MPMTYQVLIGDTASGRKKASWSVYSTIKKPSEMPSTVMMRAVNQTSLLYETKATEKLQSSASAANFPLLLSLSTLPSVSQALHSSSTSTDHPLIFCFHHLFHFTSYTEPSPSNASSACTALLNALSDEPTCAHT